MLLTLRGLPPDIEVSDIRRCIHSRCAVGRVLLDDLEADAGGTRRVTVATMCDADTATLRRELSGERLGVYTLLVEPYRSPDTSGTNLPNRGGLGDHGDFGGTTRSGSVRLGGNTEFEFSGLISFSKSTGGGGHNFRDLGRNNMRDGDGTTKKYGAQSAQHERGRNVVGNHYRGDDGIGGRSSKIMRGEWDAGFGSVIFDERNGGGALEGYNEPKSYSIGGGLSWRNAIREDPPNTYYKRRVNREVTSLEHQKRSLEMEDWDRGGEYPEIRTDLLERELAMNPARMQQQECGPGPLQRFVESSALGSGRAPCRQERNRDARERSRERSRSPMGEGPSSQAQSARDRQRARLARRPADRVLPDQHRWARSQQSKTNPHSTKEYSFSVHQNTWRNNTSKLHKFVKMNLQMDPNVKESIEGSVEVDRLRMHSTETKAGQLLQSGDRVNGKSTRSELMTMGANVLSNEMVYGRMLTPEERKQLTGPQRKMLIKLKNFIFERIKRILNPSDACIINTVEEVCAAYRQQFPAGEASALVRAISTKYRRKKSLAALDEKLKMRAAIKPGDMPPSKLESWCKGCARQVADEALHGRLLNSKLRDKLPKSELNALMRAQTMVREQLHEIIDGRHGAVATCRDLLQLYRELHPRLGDHALKERAISNGAYSGGGHKLSGQEPMPSSMLERWCKYCEQRFADEAMYGFLLSNRQRDALSEMEQNKLMLARAIVREQLEAIDPSRLAAVHGYEELLRLYRELHPPEEDAALRARVMRESAADLLFNTVHACFRRAQNDENQAVCQQRANDVKPKEGACSIPCVNKLENYTNLTTSNMVDNKATTLESEVWLDTLEGWREACVSRVTYEVLYSWVLAMEHFSGDTETKIKLARTMVRKQLDEIIAGDHGAISTYKDLYQLYRTIHPLEEDTALRERMLRTAVTIKIPAYKLEQWRQDLSRQVSHEAFHSRIIRPRHWKNLMKDEQKTLTLAQSTVRKQMDEISTGQHGAVSSYKDLQRIYRMLHPPEEDAALKELVIREAATKEIAEGTQDSWRKRVWRRATNEALFGKVLKPSKRLKLKKVALLKVCLLKAMVCEQLEKILAKNRAALHEPDDMYSMYRKSNPMWKDPALKALVTHAVNEAGHENQAVYQQSVNNVKQNEGASSVPSDDIDFDAESTVEMEDHKETTGDIKGVVDNLGVPLEDIDINADDLEDY